MRLACIRTGCAMTILWAGLMSNLLPAQDLNLLITELLETNPSLLAGRRSVDAKRARVVPERTLPDPMVSVQSMGDIVPLSLQRGDPSSGRSLSLVQEIPFPGKLDLRGQVAVAVADEEWWKYELLRRDLVAELRVAYYDLHLARETEGLLLKTREHLRQISQVSAVRYSVGQSAQQDLLKSQVEVSRLLEGLREIRREQSALEFRINALLNRPPGTPPIASTRLTTIPVLRRGVRDLYEAAFLSNPEVRMSRRAVDRRQLETSLARRSSLPDFQVTLSWINRPGMPEMFGFMVGAKIPLFYWRRQKPEVEAAVLEVAAERKRYEAVLSSLNAQIQELHLEAESNLELLQLYGEAISPQASLALESAIAGYQVGDVDFLTVLNNLTTLFEIELKHQQLLAGSYKALARLEALTGESLIP